MTIQALLGVLVVVVNYLPVVGLLMTKKTFTRIVLVGRLRLVARSTFDQFFMGEFGRGPGNRIFMAGQTFPWIMHRHGWRTEEVSTEQN